MTALRILVAPLNWGLGHAARCLPIARALAGGAEARGLALELHWASDGQALGLLRAEWPRARHHELPGYGVRYPTKSATLNMLASAPRAFAAVVAERARAACRAPWWRTSSTSRSRAPGSAASATPCSGPSSGASTR